MGVRGPKVIKISLGFAVTRKRVKEGNTCNTVFMKICLPTCNSPQAPPTSGSHSAGVRPLISTSSPSIATTPCLSSSWRPQVLATPSCLDCCVYSCNRSVSTSVRDCESGREHITFICLVIYFFKIVFFSTFSIFLSMFMTSHLFILYYIF